MGCELFREVTHERVGVARTLFVVIFAICLQPFFSPFQRRFVGRPISNHLHSGKLFGASMFIAAAERVSRDANMHQNPLIP